MTRIRIMLFAVIIVCQLPFAWADIIHVPADYASIEDAIWYASSGDSVLIAPGVYYENNTGLRSGVWVIGEDGDPRSVIVDFSEATHCRGFGGIETNPGLPPIIESLTIRGSSVCGIELYRCDLRIANCIIERNGGPHLDDWYFGELSGGIYIEQSSPVIRDCLFIDNSGSYAGAINAVSGNEDDDPVLVASCTFFGNAGGAAGCIYGTYQAEVRVRNSIFAFNDGGGVADLPYGTDFQCCNSYGNAGGDYLSSGGSGNISQDPLFCDPAGGDFSLVVKSPCLPWNNDCGVRMGSDWIGDCALPVCETIRVPEDYSSVEDALAMAVHCDTVLVGPGTYDCNAEIRSGIVLRSLDGPDETFLIGGGDGAVLSVGAGPPLDREDYPVRIEGFTIEGGTDSGIRIRGADAVIVDCVIRNNSSETDGGGLLAFDGDIDVERCLIYDNEAARGGGLFFAYGSGRIEHCTIVRNTAGPGGGVHFYDCSPYLERSIIAFNFGSGLGCENGGNPRVSCCDIYGNGDDENCGADYGGNFSLNPLFCDTEADDFRLGPESPCLPENNICYALIGAREEGDCEPPGCRVLLVPSEYPTITAALDEATACDTVLVAQGGYTERITVPPGVVLKSEAGPVSTYISAGWQGTAVTIGYDGRSDRDDPITVVDGFSIQRGNQSGLQIHHSSPLIRNCIIRLNAAEERGGGIYCHDAEPVFENCIIKSNESEEDGGGIFLLGSTPEFVNCLIRDNTAMRGGAMVCYSGSSPSIVNCTIVENTGTSLASGIQCDNNSNPSFQRCILAFNLGAPLFECDSSSEPSVSCSDVFANTGGDWICGGDAGWNISADPRFCLEGIDDYSLQPDSPCLPENNDCGDLMGAFGLGDCEIQGCQVLRVPEEYWNIGDALGAAGYCDTVLVSPGTYPGNLVLPAGITLISTSGPDSTFIEGFDEGSVILIGTREADRDTLSILVQGFTLRGASDSGVRIANNAPRFVDCVISDNSSAGSGGGVKCWQAAPIFDNCVIESNQAEGYGGGVYLERSDATFLGCLIMGNQAAVHGGGIHQLDSWPLYENLTLEANHALRGGGLFVDGQDFILEGCRFIENSSDDDGGGLFLYFRDNLHVEGCEFIGNRAGMRGGAILNPNRVTDCLFQDNVAEDGGGALSLMRTGIQIHGSTFVDNRSATASVLWFSGGASATVYRSLLAFNGEGPTVGGSYTGALDFDCCDFWQNAGSDEEFLLLGAGNFQADPLFCDPVLGDWTLSSGSPCLPDGNDCEVLIGAYGQGCGLRVKGILGDGDLTAEPNPFNPSTQITFTLPEAGPVRLSVYDIAGRRHRLLNPDRSLAAGTHRYVWDGRDDRGRELSSGVYFLRLETREGTLSRKLVLLK